MGIVASTNVSFKDLYRGTSWGQSTSTIADVSTNKQYVTSSVTHLRNQFGIEYDVSNPINGTQGTEWKASQTVGLYLADLLITQNTQTNFNGNIGVGAATGYGTRYNPNSITGLQLSVDGELISDNGSPVLVDNNFFGVGFETVGGGTPYFRLGLESDGGTTPPIDIITSIIIQISGNAAITGNGQQDCFKLDLADASINSAPVGTLRLWGWTQTDFGDNTAWNNMVSAWDGSGDMFIAFVA